jgi:hypothetical protein
MKIKKTTKTELNEAVRHFYWHIAYVTGGTKDESLRQAPRAVIGLQEEADKVALLLTNLSKPALSDTWLCDLANSIPSRLQNYRNQYLAA